MLRRSLIGAALALPAAKAGAICYADSPYDDGSGSSVSPFGRGGAYCTQPIRPGHQSFDFVRYSMEVMFNEYLGFKAPPNGLQFLPGGASEIWARIQQSAPGERDELTQAATWVGLGSASGQAIGHFTRFGGSLGGAVGAGIGLVGYLWGASQVFIQTFVNTTGAYSTNFNLDGRSSFLNAWGAGGMGGFGICFPEYSNGGGGAPCFMVRLY